MGLPTTPQDAAPAYDEVVDNEHVYGYRGQSSSAPNGRYAAVPQDDVELHAHEHNDTSPSPAPTSQPETFAQTIAGVFRPKPHVHCEQCDAMTTTRMRRENEKHCCTMVAATFVAGFVCFMILGIIVAATVSKAKRHGH